MAPGAIRIASVAAVIKVYFLLKAWLGVLRLIGWHSCHGGGGAAPGGAAPWRLGLRSGAGRAQVELPCGGAEAGVLLGGGARPRSR